MAEGWARALRGDRIEAHSAGTNPHGLNPLAVRAMREAGVDISAHTSKRPEDIRLPFDIVVTVCDSAHEACPVFPGARIVHVPFDDPPRLARDARTDEQALPHYRRVRDQIRSFIENLPAALAMPGPGTGSTTPQSCTTTGLNDPRGSTIKEIPMNTSNDTPCCAPGCCGGPASPAPTPTTATLTRDDAVRQQVREGYAAIARAGSWSAAQPPSTPVAAPAAGCCTPALSEGGGCCGPATFSPEQLAAAIGYSRGDLAAIPDTANMGLSCGNPTAIASLRPGETVLDLGSGGGFDCFVAGPKVGPAGRIIGVDMTPDMLARARANTAAYTAHTGLRNVEFRPGEIENLPVADACVDVVISNCVLNLSPDKPRAWREIARVLRPGGRVAVSDLALLRPLPEAVRGDVEALVGCIAGAVLVEEMRRQMLDAGLADVVLTPNPRYIEAMTRWKDPLYRKIMARLPAGTRPADFITSLEVSARKPA
jgi:SAM-dependent methyltransferase/protein-tyrosine-phosphatase